MKLITNLTIIKCCLIKQLFFVNSAAGTDKHDNFQINCTSKNSVVQNFSEKSCSKKLPGAYPRQTVTFLKLHVDSQQMQNLHFITNFS